MKEAFRMWKYSSMIFLTLLTAAIYVGGLVPFKSIALIPGFTEIRPANLFPVLFGLLFGPAGAWGSAIGNLAADCFGTLSLGSIFGFIGNFLYAYIPFKVWGKLGIFNYQDSTPNINSAKKLVEFGIVTFLASASCALIIAWGSDALKLVPFTILSTIIVLNNTVITMILGPLVMPIVYPRVKKLGLLWTDILLPEDISLPVFPKFYSFLVLIGSVGGLVTGLAISYLTMSESLAVGISANAAGNIGIGLGVLPFLIIMFFGASKL